MQIFHDVWPMLVSAAAAVGVIGGILEFLKGGERPWVDAAKGVWRVFYWVTIFFHYPVTAMLARKRDAKVLQSLQTKASDRDRQIEEQQASIKRIERALFNGGSNGLVHQIGIAMARTGDALEAAPCPLFECDLSGNNTNTNFAYRSLIGATTMAELSNQRWKSVLHGPNAQEYVNRFNEASVMKSDFIGECDFKNPWTGEHVGRWRVHARLTLLVDGSGYYIGRFIAALDDTAKRIVSERGWDTDG